MKIAVDCRYIGKSGIGRVCQGILDNLDYAAHEYYFIGKKDYLSSYEAKGAHIVEDDTDPYSVKGLLSFDKKLNKLCNCMIVPNFLIPLGVKIPVHSVMHDLAFLDVKVTTKNFVDRFIKRSLLKRGMKKSKTVACVSDFTRGRCYHYFKKYADKCYVNHIGLSESVLSYQKPAGLEKRKNTLIYVGNVKPHKGLKTLIAAYHALPKGEYMLKIIGEKDNFLTGMTEAELAYEDVEFTGKLPDTALLDEIASATYLVQPSQYEGFGLPPLEALYLGTTPVISDIPVFREVYGDLPVTFFRVDDAADLKEKLVLAPPTVGEEVKEEIVKRYHYAAFAGRLCARAEGK